MSTSGAHRQQGVSLIELIVFIVVVSAAAAGVLTAFTASTRGSADPMIQKQALAIAEAFLEEVQLQPFTYCDPDDSNAATALTATVNAAVTTECHDTLESSGPEGESRYSTVSPFDNVNDYNGFDSNTATPSGIRNINQDLIDGLDGYRVNIAVAGQPLSGVGNDGAGKPQSLLITVTVSGPGNTTVVLHGYRLRYAPNALP
jgi:MSHA pilin protein MshD